jgi:gas vesicle protein
MCKTFRETAETTQFDAVKEKLNSLADTLEPMATKLYFKTQKGTEDMEEMTKQFEDLKGKLAACQEAGAAQNFCIPFYDRLEKIMKHVRTMKVRMT